MKLDSLNSKYTSTILKRILPLFILLLIGHTLFTLNFLREEKALQQSSLRQNILSYQSNFSEKFSILTSSTVFVDFLRSGEKSRDDQILDIKILFSNLKDETIKGISLISEQEEIFFKMGEDSNEYITLKLCYLNDFLDSNLGSCRFKLKVFIDKERIETQVLQANPLIEKCSSCSTPFLSDSLQIGSFHISEDSGINLSIKPKTSSAQNLLILFEVILLTSILIISISIHKAFTTISLSYLTEPLKKIIASLNQFTPLKDSSFEINEIQFLSNSINDFIEKSKEQEELRKQAFLGDLATQVAHDIRSPLGILKSAKDEISSLPESTKEIIQLSITRLEEITNELLHQNKRSNNLPLKQTSPEDILALTREIITEKKFYLKGKPIIIDDNEIQDSCEFLSLVERNQYKNILSNIINNAAESIEGAGVISILLESDSSWNIIKVSDTGNGIEEKQLSSIFERGRTTKENGNGIGLYTARKYIYSWGGRIEVKSLVGKGTTFSIYLPIVGIKSKSIINESIKPVALINQPHSPPPLIVLIDDDKFVRLSWKLFFKNRSMDIELFESVDQFLALSSSFNKNARIYIDSNLANSLKGEIESEKIFKLGFTNLYLSTGYDQKDIKSPYWIKGIYTKNPEEII